MGILELNYWVALGTVLLQIGGAVLLLVYVFPKNPIAEFISSLAGKYGMLLGLLLTLAAVVMSLVYSEYFGIDPCGLCWFQRIFMYPQAVLFAVALFLKDTKAAVYSIWLSVFGAGIALYQHYLQMGGHDVIPCPATGEGDCAKRFLFEFGYVTFPLVAFSLFVFLIVLMLFVLRRAKSDAWK